MMEIFLSYRNQYSNTGVIEGPNTNCLFKVQYLKFINTKGIK